jgi:hypothetical protein
MEIHLLLRLFAVEHLHAESGHPRFYWSQRVQALIHWIQQFASAKPFGMRDANSNGRTAGALSRHREFKFQDEEIPMFDGKNNRLLDSLSFRAALITAVVALWSGAGYVLLALA